MAARLSRRRAACHPLSWSASGLPTGMSIVQATGQIIGTPQVTGSFAPSISVMDSSSPPITVSSNFSINISNQLLITTANLPQGSQFGAYNFAMNATGGAPPYTWSSSTLPLGLSINPSTGLISGSPQGQGTTPVSITVKDTTGPPNNSVTANYSLFISAPVLPVIVNGGAPISIGQKLQGPLTFSVTTPSPVDVPLTLVSGNSGVMLLNAGAAGLVSQMTVTLPANQTSVGVNAIGVATGTATLTVTGPGYGGGSNVTITPSGFTLVGPAGSTLNVNQGGVATLTVAVAQLDNAGAVLSTNQPLAPGVTALVTLNSSATTVGTITASVNFSAGDTSKSATFTAQSTGSTSSATTTLTATGPGPLVAGRR